MPWCALLTAVNNYNKSLGKLQDFFFKTKTKWSGRQDQDFMIQDQDFHFCSRRRRRASRPRPCSLEDYITGNNIEPTSKNRQNYVTLKLWFNHTYPEYWLNACVLCGVANGNYADHANVCENGLRNFSRLRPASCCNFKLCPPPCRKHHRCPRVVDVLGPTASFFFPAVKGPLPPPPALGKLGECRLVIRPCLRRARSRWGRRKLRRPNNGRQLLRRNDSRTVASAGERRAPSQRASCPVEELPAVDRRCGLRLATASSWPRSCRRQLSPPAHDRDVTASLDKEGDAARRMTSPSAAARVATHPCVSPGAPVLIPAELAVRPLHPCLSMPLLQTHLVAVVSHLKCVFKRALKNKTA